MPGSCRARVCGSVWAVARWPGVRFRGATSCGSEMPTSGCFEVPTGAVPRRPPPQPQDAHRCGPQMPTGTVMRCPPAPSPDAHCRNPQDAHRRRPQMPTGAVPGRPPPPPPDAHRPVPRRPSVRPPDAHQCGPEMPTAGSRDPPSRVPEVPIRRSYEMSLRAPRDTLPCSLEMPTIAVTRSRIVEMGSTGPFAHSRASHSPTLYFARTRPARSSACRWPTAERRRPATTIAIVDHERSSRTDPRTAHPNRRHAPHPRATRTGTTLRSGPAPGPARRASKVPLVQPPWVHSHLHDRPAVCPPRAHACPHEEPTRGARKLDLRPRSTHTHH